MTTSIDIPVEMLTPADYSSQQEYEVGMRTLEILIREYEAGKPDMSVKQVLEEIGVPHCPLDEDEVLTLNEDNYKVAKLSVERFRATIH